MKEDLNPKPTTDRPQHANTFTRLWQALNLNQADLVLGVQSLLLSALYILLMVKDRTPWLGLGAFALLWLAYAALSGHLSFPTPLDMPILALCTLALLSLSISVVQPLTLPKVQGLLLSCSIFFIIVNAVRDQNRLQLTALILVALALGVAALGLVGTDWRDRLNLFPQVYEWLPRLISEVPRSTSGGGIHKNILGGGLAFLLPLLGSLLWDGDTFDLAFLSRKKGQSKWIKRALKSLVLLAFLMVVLTLFLSQSRGAYLGVVVGLIALAIWKDRRFLLLLPILAVGVGIVLLVYADGNLTAMINLLDFNEGGTLPGRIEIWRRALYLIQDFPFSGVGMGTFGELTNALYPYFTTAEPQIPHAHNTFLSVAIDLGIPALVLYLAMLSSFVMMVCHAYPKAQPFTRVILIGLSCGMLAHQVFGIMDAYMLGNKLGIIMWIYYGLVSAIFVNQRRLTQGVDGNHKEQPTDLLRNPQWRVVRRTLLYLLFCCANWILLSLLAVTLVNINIILSLAAAVLGGILLGVMSTLQYLSVFGSKLLVRFDE